MIEQLTQNWLCWAILLLALVCYYQLWMEYFGIKVANLSSDSNETRQSNISLKQEFSGVLVGALPLMGLLGTIIGLLDCFVGIASDGASSELVSGGIADALLTTQLGLICAVPGWLLQAYVRASYHQPRLDSAVFETVSR